MRFCIKSIFFIILGLQIILAENLSSAREQYSLRQQQTDPARLITAQGQRLPDKTFMIHPQEHQYLLGKTALGRPSYLDKSYLTADGHFKIHYTLSGENAVEATISNPANVPDWVYLTGQIAERVYRLLIDTLGFDPPPPDNGKDGPEIDIYIRDFTSYNYAWTWPEDPVSATERNYDYTAYLEIDNDYIESWYYTHGDTALKVTLAHEIFHMVQLGYNWYPSNNLPGIGYGDGDRFFLEWSSTWFEEYAYPQINDYQQYIGVYFHSPSDYMWSGSYWYALGIFINYLVSEYEPALLVSVWEQIKSKPAFDALQTVLTQQTGKALSWHWNEFVRRSYYTGSRYVAESALSADALDFPLLAIAASHSDYLLDQVNFSASAKAFATVPFKVKFSRSQFIGIDQKPLYGDSLTASYILDIDSAPDPYAHFSLNKDTYIGPAGQTDTLVIFMTNTAVDPVRLDYSFTVSKRKQPWIAARITNLYPNPLNYTHGALNFSLNIDARNEQFQLSIYDLRGRRLYRGQYQIEETAGNNYTYSLPLKQLAARPLPSGIYFLQLQTSKENITRPFTFIK